MILGSGLLTGMKDALSGSSMTKNVSILGNDRQYLGQALLWPGF